MRDFTWHVFAQTGDIEAYLLYKEMHALGTPGAAPDTVLEEEEGAAAGEAAAP